VQIRERRGVDGDVHAENSLVAQGGARVDDLAGGRRNELRHTVKRQGVDGVIEGDGRSVGEAKRALREVDALEASVQMDPLHTVAERLRQGLDAARERVPELCRRSDLVDVVAERPGDHAPEVGRGDATPDPVVIHPARLDRPHLSRVRDHQMLCDGVAEETPHPLLVVRGRELPACLLLDRGDEVDQALGDEVAGQPVQVRLERKARVEVVRTVVDEGLPLLRREVAGQQVANELLGFGVRGKQDVRPVVERVPVADDRSRVAAYPFLLVVELPMILAALLERICRAQSGEAGAEDDVLALNHGLCPPS
jgi:hypothetical protein